MTNSQIEGLTGRKPLRLWPGVVAVVLLFLARFGVKAVIPGFRGFSLGLMWSFGAVVAVIVWWMFFSRARWSERFGGILLMIAGLGGAWFLRHESMGPVWIVGWALPWTLLALVAGAVASNYLPEVPRLRTMAATILLACGVWTLVRTEGITGDHVAEFGWRWAKSPEERLLAKVGHEKVVTPPPMAAETPKQPAQPIEKPVPKERAIEKPAALPAASTGVTKLTGTWPGFRGPGRDGVVRGVRIETDWAKSPPVEIWRHPIGPGWSSFAVSGDLIYTQEQRGDEEVVACYKAATGAPVWIHGDPARFFESNGGPGPRSTPTLSNGRVYTFGATGILNVLDAGNGSVVWSRNAASDTTSPPGGKPKVPDWGYSSSPLVVDDTVIVAVAGQLAAFDIATGKPRWFGPSGGGSYSSPQLVTIGGVAQVLLLSDSGATTVAPADGKQLWAYKWRGASIVQPAMTADGDVLMAVGGGTRRLAVEHGSGGWTVTPRWTSSGLKPYFNDFVVHGDYVFGFDGRILSCIDLKDGSRKWKGGRYGNGQLILLPEQDLLLVLSEEGELALVKATPDQFTEVAHFKAIEGKTWNHPVLVGDVLLVRNGEEMAAFRLTPARSTSSSDSP